MREEDEEKRIVKENPKHYIIKLPLPRTSSVGANLMTITLIESKRNSATNW
jgi:hypothetical protein